MSLDERPKTKPVAKSTRNGTTYVVYSNGTLWTTGQHGFCCGYISDPDNIEGAIDAHEEEMFCLIADAQAEFCK